MTTATDLTFDLATPRRPTLEDAGGGAFQDSLELPPDATTMPHAGQLNHGMKLDAALGRVMPVAVVWVRIVSGTPVIYAAQGAGTGISAATFSVTDEVAGRVRLEWASTAFPSPLGEPDVSLTYTSDANNPTLAAMCAPVAEMITNGCRIRTWNQAGTLTDCNFRLALY